MQAGEGKPRDYLSIYVRKVDEILIGRVTYNYEDYSKCYLWLTTNPLDTSIIIGMSYDLLQLMRVELINQLIPIYLVDL